MGADILQYNIICTIMYLIESFLNRWVDAKVDHGVGEWSTHVELHWQVVATLQAKAEGAEGEEGGREQENLYYRESPIRHY